MNILYLVFESIKNPIVESQVIEMCNKIKSKQESVNFTIVTLEPELDKMKIIEEEDITFVHIQRSNNFFKNYISYFVKIARIACRSKINIIHVRSYVPMPIALLFKKLKRCKVIFDMRGLLPEEYIYLKNKSNHNVIYKMLKIFERWFVKKSDQIIVVSNNFKNYLLEKYKYNTDIEIIYCSANDSIDKTFESYSKGKFLERYKITKTQITIAYVGSFYKYQNIEEIFKFVYELKKKINIKFLIFTKNDKKDLIEKLYKYGFIDNDIAVDYLPSNVLTQYLRYCDFGIIYRDNSVINKVSSPIKISEYIMNNMKIIYAGSIGDFNVILEQYGCGIDISTSKNSFSKIDTYMRNEKNPESLKKIVSYDFNADKYISVYMKLYRNKN